MSGIYGDMLLYFPEQFVTLTAFGMTPDINGGYQKVEGSDIVFKGIYQNQTINRLKENNGNLVKSGGLDLWTDKGELDSLFIILNGTSYRIEGSNNWDREGGFYHYMLIKVVGNDGTNTTDTTWNTGANSFG